MSFEKLTNYEFYYFILFKLYNSRLDQNMLFLQMLFMLSKQ